MVCVPETNWENISVYKVCKRIDVKILNCLMMMNQLFKCSLYSSDFRLQLKENFICSDESLK